MNFYFDAYGYIFFWYVFIFFDPSPYLQGVRWPCRWEGLLTQWMLADMVWVFSSCPHGSRMSCDWLWLHSYSFKSLQVWDGGLWLSLHSCLLVVSGFCLVFCSFQCPNLSAYCLGIWGLCSLAYQIISLVLRGADWSADVVGWDLVWPISILYNLFLICCYVASCVTLCFCRLPSKQAYIKGNVKLVSNSYQCILHTAELNRAHSVNG